MWCFSFFVFLKRAVIFYLGKFSLRWLGGVFCFCLQRWGNSMAIEEEDGFCTGVQRWCVGTVLLEGDLDICFAYSGVDYTKPLVGGVLPDGTQRTREGGNCRSGAASSPLPCPPRPPTPPPLTGLVWVVTNILRRGEGWEKGLVQLKG